MNWRNPFLITYLSVTVAGAAILGYFAYAAWTHAQEVNDNYIAAVNKLHGLQNRTPFPNDDNNAKYVEYTEQYRAEYDKLVAKVAGMQKPVENLSPQDFQSLLRASVSQVEQAAKENNVTLPPDFFLGFDQYRGALPQEAAAGPLARELAAIRLVVDQLIQLKVHEITGLKRDLLPEEGGRAAAAAGMGGNNNRPPGGNRPIGGGMQPSRGGSVVVSNAFDIAFVANQGAARAALNDIASADQFFIIRNLTVENSATEGPARGDTAAAEAPPPQPDPNQPGAVPGAPPAPPQQNTVTVLVGRETLTVSLHIEMITFNNLPGSGSK